MTIHPQIIEKAGNKEFVVLPYEEFVALQEELEEYRDLRELREAKKKAGDEEPVSVSEVRSDLLGPGGGPAE